MSLRFATRSGDPLWRPAVASGASLGPSPCQQIGWARSPALRPGWLHIAHATTGREMIEVLKDKEARNKVIHKIAVNGYHETKNI